MTELVARASIPTRHGQFSCAVYADGGIEHMVLFIGDVADGAPVLVRVHSECLTGDVFGSRRCDCGAQLDQALERISAEGRGVLVYLRGHEGRGIGLGQKIVAYSLQDTGLDTVEANLALGFKADARDYGVGIQILKDLGLRRVRLLTNNPKKTDAFIYGGFDLEVVDQVPILPPVHEFNQRYLQTKREKMGHHFPE
jgi:3,4-dihydroxy 2-butanone 4-phosphate synthase/GTP cyclohydrolase II